MTFSKKFDFKSTKNQWKGVHNKKCDSILYWCRIFDNGWRRTVFHDKTNVELSQFTESVTCREYTLPRGEKSCDSKGWIRGNTKIGPVLEITASNFHGKFGVEIRMVFVYRFNSLSWVTIFMAWISWSRTSATTKRTTTTNRKPLRCSSKMLRWKRMYLLLRAELRINQNHKDVIMSAHPQELHPSGKESALVEPGYYSPVACPLWKQLSTLLRHGHLPQEDGAIEFLESKDYLWNKFVRTQHCSDEMWKSRMTKRQRK